GGAIAIVGAVFVTGRATRCPWPNVACGCVVNNDRGGARNLDDNGSNGGPAEPLHTFLKHSPVEGISACGSGGRSGEGKGTILIGTNSSSHADTAQPPTHIVLWVCRTELVISDINPTGGA